MTARRSGDTVVIVVARDQLALYDYFKWGFAGARDVEVVLDRRLGTRRDRGRPPLGSAERRRSERRHDTASRAELLARGFVITRRRPAE